MNEPWGLSGTQFLLIYLILLGGAFAGIFYTLGKVRSSSARMSKGAPALEVYETAYLAGGPRRVVDTAVAGLADIGRIRVDSDGRLIWVGKLARQPVEQAVSVQLNQGPCRLSDLRRALRQHPAITDIGRKLAGFGLVAKETKIALAHLAAWALAVPFALGVVRLVAELRAGEMNVALAVLLVVNAAGLAWFVRIQPFRTWYGNSVLRTLERTTPPTGYQGPGLRLRDPLAQAGAATVALFGLTAVYDPALREALERSSRIDQRRLSVTRLTGERPPARRPAAGDR
jgi:uncharacterized protein (TIGR04222 family)